MKKNKQISFMIILTMMFTFISAPIIEASNHYFTVEGEYIVEEGDFDDFDDFEEYIDEEFEEDLSELTNNEDFQEELSEVTGEDFTELDMSNFEEEFDFLVDDPVFEELEERITLGDQDTYMEAGTVSGQWVPVAAAAIRMLAKKVGKAPMKKAWNAARGSVNKALKNKRYGVYTNVSSGRYIGITDKKMKGKKKTIFALDYHKYKLNGKRTTKSVLHYHIRPNMSTHHNIYPLKPKFK